jgi:hypothetical protein
MEATMIVKNRKFKVNDYVVLDYEGDKFNAKILAIVPDGYRISVCIDTINEDDRLMQEMVVPEYRLSSVGINIVG